MAAAKVVWQVTYKQWFRGLKEGKARVYTETFVGPDCLAEAANKARAEAENQVLHENDKTYPCMKVQVRSMERALDITFGR